MNPHLFKTHWSASAIEPLLHLLLGGLVQTMSVPWLFEAPLESCVANGAGTIQREGVWRFWNIC